MIDSRRWPRPMPSARWKPSPSGPRCARLSVIASRRRRSIARLSRLSKIPTRPHIAFAFRCRDTREGPGCEDTREGPGCERPTQVSWRLGRPDTGARAEPNQGAVAVEGAVEKIPQIGRAHV